MQEYEKLYPVVISTQIEGKPLSDYTSITGKADPMLAEMLGDINVHSLEIRGNSDSLAQCVVLYGDDGNFIVWTDEV